MASLTLRVALLLVFAALLVVQCSSDSSDCSSDSDESSNGWGPRRFGPSPANNTGVAPAPFVPQPPDNSTLPSWVELLMSAGRKKRSPHGHTSDWGRWGPRRGGNGRGPRRFGPPPANNTGVAPAPFVPQPSNSTLPTMIELLYPGFIGRKKRSPYGHGKKHQKRGRGGRPRGPSPGNITSGGALRPDFPPDFPIGNSTYSPEEFFRLIGRKKRSPNGDSSESSSDTSGESSNGAPPEV
ncbi:hypothetical protein GPALN_005107 [Globodera pallida]|uniref:Secreted protein n=1 Tax=Globodera pallida TaxID=36090 RepID=A0A183BRU5_GLOPA|nr:hypothetical protein GPALN_005107 [Globodera pallida]